MTLRPRWEILVGDVRLLDYLVQEGQEDLPHPLQETIEAIIQELTDEEREVFYLRYGEGLSIREIGKMMLGYVSNNTIQTHLSNIEKKVREALEQD